MIQNNITHTETHDDRAHQIINTHTHNFHLNAFIHPIIVSLVNPKFANEIAHQNSLQHSSLINMWHRWYCWSRTRTTILKQTCLKHILITNSQPTSLKIWSMATYFESGKTSWLQLQFHVNRKFKNTFVTVVPVPMRANESTRRI